LAADFNESKIDLTIDQEAWEDPSTPEYFTEDQIETRVNWWFQEFDSFSEPFALINS